MTRAIALVVLALAGQCTPTPTPPAPLRACVQWCDRLTELGCDVGPTPDGHMCLDVCETTEATGYTTLHPECAPLVMTCDDADRLSADGCKQ
jgi:hypothetical protein